MTPKPPTHLRLWGCPDCSRYTLYTYYLDNAGEPDGDVWCTTCGWSNNPDLISAGDAFGARSGKLPCRNHVSFDDTPLDMQSFVQTHDCMICGAPMCGDPGWSDEDGELHTRWECPTCRFVEWEPEHNEY